ncbi:MAG: phosphodiester glycosidase family protein [Rhodobiaceae bacterium]|nr:phosphodiester glycosidase family protein [Rhodobiaceae bacterium]MCC0016136.1 phosphodiester glycosidase family protein [Rhodobiaceae bacterium]MCC0041259.1 phosphodiester glycosidase family protein [Rhodobiaceae bacterium]
MRFVCVLLAIVFAACGPAAAAEPPVACGERSHGEISAIVCTVDVTRADMRLFLDDPDGKPYGRFPPLIADLEASGQRLAFAMNAGMYHEDLSPVGLYIENGHTLKRANTNPGPGNFHMLPNGVFWFGGGRAGASETKAFLRSGRKPAYATQSGPMLVVNGRLHPRFLPDSTSRKRRNGVGVRDSGKTAVFAISKGFVTFHQFATLFRDGLGCDDALFLDGTISSLHAPQVGRSDRAFPMGPIVGVVE